MADSVPFRSRASNTATAAWIPVVPGSQAVELWRDDSALALDSKRWRIGDRSDPRSPLLVHALQAAADDDTNEDSARAWALLLRTDHGPRFLLALQQIADDELLTQPQWHELRQLLSLLAARSPAAVAQLFPHAVSSRVLGLCGPDGLAAALRELGSGQGRRRQEAAAALLELHRAGVDVPTAPLLAALKHELNPEAREQILGVLRVLEVGTVPAAGSDDGMHVHGRLTARPKRAAGGRRRRRPA